MIKAEEIVCPECGCIFDHKAVKTVGYRSDKHHKAFFHMIRVAEENWPEDYKDFQPDGLTIKMRRDHLRAWITCKAGWRTQIGKPLEATAGPVEKDDWWAHILLQAMHYRKYVFPADDAATGRKFAVTPKSIAEEECDPVDYRQVFDEVKHLIEEIVGFEIKFLPPHLRELRDVWGHEPGKREGADKEARIQRQGKA